MPLTRLCLQQTVTNLRFLRQSEFTDAATKTLVTSLLTKIKTADDGNMVQLEKLKSDTMTKRADGSYAWTPAQAAAYKVQRKIIETEEVPTPALTVAEQGLFNTVSLQVMLGLQRDTDFI